MSNSPIDPLAILNPWYWTNFFLGGVYLQLMLEASQAAMTRMEYDYRHYSAAADRQRKK